MIAVFAVVRAVHFAGVMSVFGAAAYILLLRREAYAGVAPPELRLFFARAAALALVTAIAGIGFVAGQMSGDWRSAVDPATLEAVIRETRYGQIFLVRIVGLVVLLLLWVFRTRSRIPLSALVAALLLGALALTSHAAASGGDSSAAVFRAANDMIHLLAGGFWLGGLVVLSMMMRQHRGEPAKLAGAIRVFSVWGTYVVAILAVSGIANAASILPKAALSSPASRYDELLLTKVGIAFVMIVLAAVNRWHFAPALSGAGTQAGQNLARSIRAEIALGLAVVAIAGFLGVMSPR